ncbi:ChaB family protein [Fictibacillus aquaticus]|uniref:Cation transporter n=1 Tax=Fictibacillus aquaticus TaxID=2021314 RepID=A0A235FDL5_9BACL|nr:ChaB family protein [Fictibacillus aquaticus]OYD59014.1 cation transporter [Fictibacillus aquaticus]
MPYDKLSDLPDRVKDHLPHHAQDIYKEAFNSALEEYNSEETAHKVAWSAVKHRYEKQDDGDWAKKKDT